ncbi:MAG: glycosyltransferase family 2 protein [Ruminococcus sp.]|jgi:glycosyltransferase involved in cell wall biosynthesis|nr:glycosyltransferase family 2 protein [Ruminococcus sp.]
MPLISIIVPCFNEEEVLNIFRDEILLVTNEMAKQPDVSFEFLFIDDGSKDRTLKVLRDFNKLDGRFRYISFSRNFGKESAMYAGLKNAKGDYCVILDADLQHPPELIPKMYELVSGGEYDCAATRRISRKGEPRLLSFFSKSFYKIINKISQTEIIDGAQDFRFMNRQMVDAILSMSEYSRFSKGIFSWVGFDTKYIEVENRPRKAGKSTWNFWKLFSYSIDGIAGFSTAPLKFASFLGILTCIGALIAVLVMVIKFFVTGETSGGYYTLLCVTLGIGGLQLLCTGILGEYLAKTYLETKKRPIYLVKETDHETKV